MDRSSIWSSSITVHGLSTGYHLSCRTFDAFPSDEQCYVIVCTVHVFRTVSSYFYDNSRVKSNFISEDNTRLGKTHVMSCHAMPCCSPIRRAEALPTVGPRTTPSTLAKSRASCFGPSSALLTFVRVGLVVLDSPNPRGKEPPGTLKKSIRVEVAFHKERKGRVHVIHLQSGSERVAQV